MQTEYLVELEDAVVAVRRPDGKVKITDEMVRQVDEALLKIGRVTEGEQQLVTVRAVGKDREEMKRMADIFRGRIIDVTDKDYTIELTGTGSKLDAFLKAIDRSAILETVRTGASGIGRGNRILRV